MCVVSMIYDHYNPLIPYIPTIDPSNPPMNPNYPGTVNPFTVNLPTASSAEIAAVAKQIAELKQLIENFHKDVAAAKQIDERLQQPDCEDPEKKKLEERVTKLESRLDKLENMYLNRATELENLKDALRNV